MAEMAEMTYSAHIIHRGVIDLKMHGLEFPVGRVGQVSSEQGQALEANDLDPKQTREQSVSFAWQLPIGMCHARPRRSIQQ